LIGINAVQNKKLIMLISQPTSEDQV